MAKEIIRAIKGMCDILPDQDPYWDKFYDNVTRLAHDYGYMQVRTPILEQTRLFKRGIGEVTDIVEKEMYSFIDSLNGDELTLRPENTASVVRSCIENNLLYDSPRRLWYSGPMFRHERPQRGRYRQFYQFGMEALGFNGPDVDAEQLLFLRRLWDSLGIKDVTLQLNCLGQSEERQRYREELIKYFEAHREILDEEAQRRLYTNPLRILDTKNPNMQEMVEGAPKLIDFLGDNSLSFLRSLEKILSSQHLEFVINPRLVRGLDYYNLTVYEWVTDKLGAQATICGGGRYDPLIGILGGKDAPACGFAMGVERVIELMKESGVHPRYSECDVYVVWNKDYFEEALSVSESLRNLNVSTILHSGSSKFATQFKKADASGALYAVVVGEEEVKTKTASIKPLRDNLMDYGQQITVPFDQLPQVMAEKLGRKE